MSEGFEAQVLSLLASLQEGQAELRKGLAELRGEVTELRVRFSDLQERFSGQRAILDRTEGMVDQLVRDMGSVRPRISEMQWN